MALVTIPPNALVFARILGGALVFAVWQKLLPNAGPGLARRDGLRVTACALTGVVMNQLLFVNGLSRTTAVNASVLSTTIPPLTAAFALLMGMERLNALRFGGIGLALVGALVLLGVERVSGSDAHAMGNAMILLNCVSYAGFLVLVRPLAQTSPVRLAALLFACAAVATAPLGVPAWLELMPRFTERDAALLAFIIAVPTVASYALTQMAIQRTESSVVASYVYLQPVFATAGAALFLGEGLPARTVLAAALIFAGIYLSQAAGTGRKSKVNGQ